LEAELKAELEARRKQYEYYRNKLLTPVEKDGRWYLNGVEVEWKKLGEIAKIFDGTHQTPNYADSGVPFVSVENIKNIYSTKKFISYDDFNKYKVKPRKGDLFMTRIGDIGTCAVIENDDPLAYYVTLALIRIEQKIITPNYLKYLIESNIGKSELNKRILVNATPIKINLGDIGKINIPIPPLSEQERIVAILDKFDALVNDISQGLPAELEARRKQYEYYRNKLLTFKKKNEI
jgi:type I restriction enzyme S subunit